MKRTLLLVGLLLGCLMQGCKIEGDVIINRSSELIKVVLTTRDGSEWSIAMTPESVYALSGRSATDPSRRLSAVRAYGSKGNLIDKLEVDEIPKEGNGYGKYTTAVIFSDRILPAPRLSGTRTREIREADFAKLVKDGKQNPK